MNVKGTLALTRLTWTSWMAQRSFFFLLAFGWMIPPLIYLLVWAAAAAHSPVTGYTRGGFVAYYLVLIVVNQFTFCTANWTVGDAIRDGTMNTVLLRPLPPVSDALANELAGKVVFLLFDIPVVAVLALVLKPELHLTPDGVLAFVPAVVMAALLRFFAGYGLALLAFWATRADALLALQESLIFLLGGLVAPVALLPEAIRGAASILPFRFMVSFPVEVLTGRLSMGDLLIGLAGQVVWLTLAAIIARVVWRAGIRHYAAVGG